MSRTTRTEYGFIPYYHAEKYENCVAARHITNVDSPDSSETERNIILDIVKIEQPIEFDVLCRRISPIYNRSERLSPALRNKVGTIIFCQLAEQLRIYGRFVCARDFDLVKVRYRKNDGIHPREVRHICPEELMQAVTLILRRRASSFDALVNTTIKELGYLRNGTSLTTCLRRCINWMKDCGWLTVNSSNVVLTSAGRAHNFRMGECISSCNIKLELESAYSKGNVEDVEPVADWWETELIIKQPSGNDGLDKNKKSNVRRTEKTAKGERGVLRDADIATLPLKGSSEKSANKRGGASVGHRTSVKQRIVQEENDISNDRISTCSPFVMMWPYWYSSWLSSDISQTSSPGYDEPVMFYYGLLADSRALDSSVEIVQENKDLRDDDLTPKFLCYGSLRDVIGGQSGVLCGGECGSFSHSYMRTESQRISYGMGSICGVVKGLLDKSPFMSKRTDALYTYLAWIVQKCCPTRELNRNEIPYAIALMVAVFPLPGLLRLISGRMITAALQFALCFAVWKWFYLWWLLDCYLLLVNDFCDADGRFFKGDSKLLSVIGFFAVVTIVSFLHTDFLRW